MHTARLLAPATLLLAAGLHAEPLPVRTAPLGELLTPQVYSAPATVRPFNRPQLAAEVTGQILHMPVRVGEEVQAAQVLVELDCRVHQQREKTASAAVERARAQLQFAQTQLQRAQNLKRKSSISEELLEQRRTELATANADLKTQLAQKQLAAIDVQRCRITAPFDAVVAQRLGSEGGLANPGTPLLELVQISQLEVSAELRANEGRSLADAEQPEFSYQGQRYPLSLRALPALIDERTRTREARLVFDDGNPPVGAAGRLHWTSRARLLPAHFIVRRDGQLGIFLARGDKAHFAPLPGAIEGQPTQVDMDPGERLVTEGRQRLNHGDRISPADDGNGA